jgi:hypothetical protein
MGDMMDQVAAWFGALPLSLKFVLITLAALTFSLLLARQVGVALRMAEGQGVKAAKWFPWFITGLGSLMSLVFTASILRPGLLTNRGGPNDEWIELFIALSVTFAGAALLVRGKREG